MFFRAIGAVAVVGGCVGLGLYYAAKESFRANELLEFKKAMQMLSSEIEYMRSPLAVACANISARTGAATSNLFSTFAQSLTDGEGETAYQLWLQSAEKTRPDSFLAKEDWDVLEGFGKTLGYLDKNMQQNAIDHTINYINQKTTALQLQSEKNTKMYHSLGIIAGLLLTVVLW